MAELDYPSWQALAQHAETVKDFSLEQMFIDDPKRVNSYSLEAAGLYLDFSKNLIDARCLKLFADLSKEANLKPAISAMFAGVEVNPTEQRAALHTLLRSDPADVPAGLEKEASLVADTLAHVEKISRAIRSGTWQCATGKTVKNIVHLGIGGSYLGPYMIDEALAPYRNHPTDPKVIECFYVANVDGHHISQVLCQLDPRETLIIIVSKTFSTIETLTNANTARSWLLGGIDKTQLNKHLIAVTTNTDAAISFGVAADNILPLWDWVGGRYSLWSAVSLPIAIRYGFDCFREILDGAADLDKHFANTDFPNNMPMVLAWLGIWYQHFFQAETHAVLPYDHGLRFFPDHLQQLDMESNGKSIRLDGDSVNYPTGPIIWGGEGSNGQHAFHQLLHQGTRFVGLDFILPLRPHHNLKSHHDWLVASCLSQSQALMLGRSKEQLKDTKAELRSHKVMPGNRPSNTIILDQVTPRSLGALTALYEHKTFCQAVIWQINPFDQWGVELGKELGETIYSSIQTGEAGLDASTTSLTERYRRTLE